jgi:hypothetical protein
MSMQDIFNISGRNIGTRHDMNSDFNLGFIILEAALSKERTEWKKITDKAKTHSGL